MDKILPRRAVIWVALGVIIAIFAYPRWSIFPLAYLILPFYIAAIFNLKTKWQSVRLGILATMIGGFGGFHWITFVLSEMGGMPTFVAAIMHGGFNIIALPNFNAFFFLGFLLRDSIERLPIYCRPFYWAALWTSLEFLCRPIKIFPEQIGATQWDWLSISQIASFGGVTSITFLVTFVGASLFYVARDYKQKIVFASLLVSISLLLLAHFWGTQRIDSLQKLPTQNVKVAMVQANIGNADKAIAFAGVREGLRRIIRQYSDLTALAAGSRPDIILWPETAYPMSYPVTEDSHASFSSRTEARLLQEQARNLGYAMLIGGYERVHNKEYNVVVLVDEMGEPITSYKKNHLLIFGEYMPFSDWFPSLKKLNPQLGDFGRGKGPFPVVWNRKDKPPLRLGINICYEALIPDYMRSLTNNGSEVYVNFSNDSWFGPGNEPYQHLMLTAFRIIENGIPMIRSTNTGITGFIDITGKLIKSGPLFEPAVVTMDFPIPLQPVDTFYRRHGELLTWILILLTSMFSGFLFSRSRKQ